MRGVEVSTWVRCARPQRAAGGLRGLFNAKVFLEERLEQELLKIENTQPTAWVRQSANSKGLLERAVAVGDVSAGS